MKKTMKIVLATLTAITLSGGTASAATCNLTDFTIGSKNASACEGPLQGNDSNRNLDGLFKRDGWTEIVKVDDSSGTETDGGVTVSFVLGDGDDERSGSWSVTGWGSGQNAVMAVLKGGPNFSAYLLDVGKGVSGRWTTQSLVNGGGKSAGLSHLTLYSVEADISTTVAGSPDPSPVSSPSPVPLPAAGWLLLAGLGGLAALRRRELPR